MPILLSNCRLLTNLSSSIFLISPSNSLLINSSNGINSNYQRCINTSSTPLPRRFKTYHIKNFIQKDCSYFYRTFTNSSTSFASSFGEIYDITGFKIIFNSSRLHCTFWMTISFQLLVFRLEQRVFQCHFSQPRFSLAWWACTVTSLNERSGHSCASCIFSLNR